MDGAVTMDFFGDSGLGLYGDSEETLIGVI
jgi:hypothetical protein